MNYNIDLINLLSELNPIQTQLEFQKTDEKIILKAKELKERIAYKLEAPADYFDFPAESLRFYDFKKFLDFFNTFNVVSRNEELTDTPILDTVSTDDGEISNIIIQSSKGKQQFSYRTGVRGTIDVPTFNDIKIPNVASSFSISEAQIEHLRKMINLVYDNKNTPGGIKFECSGDNMKIVLFNMVSSNKYEIEYKLDTPVDKDFTLTVNREGFLLVPTASFKVEIGVKGLIFHMIRDDKIDLKLGMSYMKV